MGRALHTNFNARFKCEALKVTLYGELKWCFSFTIEVLHAWPCGSLSSDILKCSRKWHSRRQLRHLLKSCHPYFDFRVFLLTPSNMWTYLINAACNGEESEACRKIDQRKHIWLCVQIRTSQLKSSQVLFNQDVIILQLKKQKRQSPHKLTMERLSRVQLYYVGNGVVKKWK